MSHEPRKKYNCSSLCLTLFSGTAEYCYPQSEKMKVKHISLAPLTHNLFSSKLTETLKLSARLRSVRTLAQPLQIESTVLLLIVVNMVNLTTLCTVTVNKALSN